MPNPTFKLIASYEVGAGGSASIDFTSIPSTYTDLVLKYSIRTARTGDPGDEIFITFNGSATGYSSRAIIGYGNSTSSSVGGSTQINRDWAATANATASTFGNQELYIPNYAGSNSKSVSIDSVTENNAVWAYAALTAGLWSNSAAITSIKLVPEVGPTILEFSSATLYGIKNS